MDHLIQNIQERKKNSLREETLKDYISKMEIKYNIKTLMNSRKQLFFYIKNGLGNDKQV